MKTKLWIGLALALLLALLCCGAASANDSGTCGENLTWVFRSDTGELRIGGSGPMTEFGTYSAAPWYDYEPEIQYISINAGVTSIGRNAFYDCAGVESVTIPRSVESIGYLAFANCYSLTQVVILNPDAVIGDHDRDVFRSCPSGMILYGWNGSTAEAYADAESLNFTGWAPSGKCGDNASWSLSETADILTIRGTGATWDFTEGYPVFYNARIAVHSINIEEGITGLGDYLFCHMSHVESVTIPDSITHIGTGAFMGCTELGPTVTIPYHVTRIGGKAFCNCSRLKDVNVLSLTASYGPDVFSGCAAGFRIHSFHGSTAVDYASSSGFSFEIWPASGQCGDKANWSFIALRRMVTQGTNDALFL